MPAVLNIRDCPGQEVPAGAVYSGRGVTRGGGGVARGLGGGYRGVSYVKVELRPHAGLLSAEQFSPQDDVPQLRE